VYFGGKFEPQTSLKHSFVFLHWTEHGLKTKVITNDSVRTAQKHSFVFLHWTEHGLKTKVITNDSVRTAQRQSFLLLLSLLLLTAIGLSPSGSGYFTCIQTMKLITNKFKSGGLHEKHVVAT